MPYFMDVMLTGAERRREAIAESRAAGRMGANRLPASVHTEPPLSDTAIVKCLDALEAGRAERVLPVCSADDMRLWINEHFSRLEEELTDSGTPNPSKWLEQTYRIEKGRKP